MRYAILTNGVPVPTNTKTLLELGGVKYPPQVLRDPQWRADNNVVEIQESKAPDVYTYLGNITGYTDLGNGVWREDSEILTKSKKQIFDLKFADAKKHYYQVSNGGMIHNAKNYGTTTDTLNRIASVMSLRGNGRAIKPKGVFTLENELITMDEAAFIAYANAAGDHIENSYDNLIDFHVVNLTTLLKDPNATAQQLIDYDVTTGYPANPVIVEQGV